jgi:hypothetical protein
MHKVAQVVEWRRSQLGGFDIGASGSVHRNAYVGIVKVD